MKSFVKLFVLIISLYINLAAQTERNPLFEYCSGTWCGSCACGYVTLNNIIIPNNPNAIMIAYHGYATSSDPFARFVGNEIVDSLGFVAYPNGVVDRTMEPNSFTSCNNVLSDRNRTPAGVEISLTTKYNNSRNYSVFVKVHPFAKLSGDYYLQLFLLEDSLTANQAGGGDCPGGDEFLFNNICREVLNGVKGELIYSGNSWMSSDTISLNKEFLLNEDFEEANCKIVAVVYKKESALNISEVQQAVKTKLVKNLEKPLMLTYPNKLTTVLQVGKEIKLSWKKDSTITNIDLSIVNEAGIVIEEIVKNYNNNYIKWIPSENYKGGNYRLIITNNYENEADTSNLIFFKDIITNWKKSSSILPKNKNSIGYSTIINNNYLYVIGGDSSLDGSGLSNSVYYAKINEDGLLNDFIKTEDLPAGYAYGEALIHNNRIYLFSNGYNTNFKGDINSDGTLSNWIEITNFPMPLINVKTVLFNNRVFVFGLYTDGQTLNINRTYYGDILEDGSFSDFSYVQGVPQSHVGGEVVQYNGRIYFIGGDEVSTKNNVTNIVHFSKINSNNIIELWGRSNYMDTELKHFGKTIIDSVIYTVGGINGIGNVAGFKEGKIIGKNIVWYGSNLLPEPTEYANLLNNNGYLYYLTGKGSNSIYYANLSDTVTTVLDNKINELEFELLNNYPNPFNPSTTIEFSLKKYSSVDLTVYDVLGCEIKNIFNGNLPVGFHKFSFDAKGLSSGVYFYRLKANNKISIKKMLLLR